jgi:septal ring factor EnvC (AmiA/AmiB activator)
MKNDNLEHVFDTLKDNFDVEEPNNNHNERFLEKLNKRGELHIVNANSKQWRRLFTPLISVAASIILLVTIIIGFNKQPNTSDLASVSPKMAQTQDFFTNSINEELAKIKSESSPEVQKLIQDALEQIKILETDYENLKIDLNKSGEDNRVIYAMISNFQNRINILQNTINQIEIVKQLNHQSHETSTTI